MKRTKIEAQRCKQSKIKFFQATMMLLMLAMYVFASPAHANNGTQDDTIFQVQTANENSAVMTPCCIETSLTSNKKATILTTRSNFITVNGSNTDMPITMARSNHASIQRADIALDARFRDKEVASNRAITFKNNLLQDLNISDDLIHVTFNMRSDAVWFTYISMSNSNDANIDMLVLENMLQTQFRKSLTMQMAEMDFKTDKQMLSAYFGKLNSKAIEAADAQIDALFRANK